MAIVIDNGIAVPNGAPVFYNDYMGASPAFNVNLDSVIFSSVISGCEYKLTLKDASLGASGTGTLDGTEATVTYTTTGDAATQASYVVTDVGWDDEAGWLWVEGEDGPTVLDYGRLDRGRRGRRHVQARRGRGGPGPSQGPVPGWLRRGRRGLPHRVAAQLPGM